MKAELWCYLTICIPVQVARLAQMIDKAFSAEDQRRSVSLLAVVFKQGNKAKHGGLHSRPAVTLARGHVWVALFNALAEHQGSNRGDLGHIGGCEIPQDFDLRGWDLGPFGPLQMAPVLHADLHHISGVGVQVDGPVVVTLRASTASVLNAHLDRNDVNIQGESLQGVHCASSRSTWVSWKLVW